MAYPYKLIRNPKTRQEIKFLQTKEDTGGQLLEMESIYPANSKEPVPHYHPEQEEDFMVLMGELTVRLDDAIKVLRKGDCLHIPQNTTHSMWNAGNKPTIVNWKVYPAMDTEYFLETVTGLAADGKTNQEGKPNLLQLAATANRYNRVFRIAKPSFTIQRILFFLLAPLACVFGYKATYQKYLD